MPEYTLSVNGENKQVTVPAAMPLLWILRDELQLTGTRFGCGQGACGACTVLVNGRAFRSCQLNAPFALGKSITTIEGLSADASHPVQQAWMAINTPQCGYCQSGQILTAVSLLSQYPLPTDEQINEAMSTLICRCGTYYRIRKAIHHAAALMQQKK
jgi:isoquinoline 1-oxidoreductase subunit alpha